LSVREPENIMMTGRERGENEASWNRRIEEAKTAQRVGRDVVSYTV
jgi:uncharacterized protein YheU (UPF0270 family)